MAARKPTSYDIKEKLFRIHGGHCFYCGHEIDMRDFHVDHVHPVVLGGTDDFDNLVASCKFCNTSKCALDVDSWKERLSDSVAVQIGKAIDRLNLMHNKYGLDEDEFERMMKAMGAAYRSAQKIDIKLFFEREE
jgi:uncharacterized protein (TIGR02646 family)